MLLGIGADILILQSREVFKEVTRYLMVFSF